MATTSFNKTFVVRVSTSSLKLLRSRLKWPLKPGITKLKAKKEFTY
jgi:hypothetical protein